MSLCTTQDQYSIYWSNMVHPSIYFRLDTRYLSATLLKCFQALFLGKINMHRFDGFNFDGEYWMSFFAAVSLLWCLSTETFAQPQVAQEPDMKDCHYLNKIEGSSGYGKNFNWQTLAKYSALNHAEELGATHVVWEHLTPVGGFNGIAVAKAYRCQS